MKQRGDVDEVAVARARANLCALAAAHPEFVDSAAPAWTENLEALASALDDGGPMAPKDKKPAPTIQVAFRLEQSLVDRLDRHAARMSDLVPGLTFTRVDALRSILIPALDAAEQTDRGKRGR